MGQKSGYGYLEVQSGKEPERIFYEVNGEGAPVLFVNAPFLDRRMWESQVSGLQDQDIMGITFDFRGTGKSDFPKNEVSRTGDMKKLLDHLDVHKVQIVCSSTGCETALNFEEEYPNSVSGILFSSPVIDLDTYLRSSKDPQTVEFLDKKLEIEKLMKSGKFRDAVTLNVSLWGKWMEESHRERLHEISVDNYRTLRPGFYTLDSKRGEFAPKLSTLDGNYLLVLGSRALPVVQSIAHLIEKKVSGVKIVSIEGAGQFPNMEQPTEYNEVLVKFIKNR